MREDNARSRIPVYDAVQHEPDRCSRGIGCEEPLPDYALRIPQGVACEI
jgi:hypothetical protein